MESNLAVLAADSESMNIYNGSNQNELFMSYILNSDPVQSLESTYRAEFGQAGMDAVPGKRDTLVLGVRSLRTERDVNLFTYLLENIAKNTDYPYVQADILNSPGQHFIHDKLGAQPFTSTSVSYSSKIRILRYHLGIEKKISAYKPNKT